MCKYFDGIRLWLWLFLPFNLLTACLVQRIDSTGGAGTASFQVAADVLSADGNQTAHIDIDVKDAKADPWINAAIFLKASGADVLIEQPKATDADGKTTASVRCVTAGPVILSAQVLNAVGLRTPLAGTASLRCGGTPIVVVVITPTHTTAAADAGAPTSLTLRVTDDMGRPLANQAVTLAATRPGDTVVPETAVTDAQGEVQALLTATTLGTSTVVVHAGSSQATASVQFVAGPPQMAQSAWTARNSNVIANGQSATWLDLVLNDSAGRPVPYAQVTAQSSVQSDILAPVSGLTDSLGRWTSVLTGTEAGLRNVTVTTHAGSIGTGVTLVPGPISATQSTMVISPNHVMADGVSQGNIVVRLEDDEHNPIAGIQVNLTTPAPGVQLNPPTGTTDASGQIYSVVSSPVLQEANIIAQGPNITFTAPVTFLGPPSLLTSSLTASPNTGLALNGNGVASLSVVVRDAQNSPWPNTWISLATSNPFATLSPAMVQTSAFGVASASLKSSSAGPVLVVANVAPIRLAATVQFQPQSPICPNHVVLGGRPGTLRTWSNPQEIYATDMTSDGITDMVILVSSSPGIFVFPGNGDGTFQDSITQNTADSPQSMLVMDLDGDAINDVVVAGNDNAIYTHRGLGAGQLDVAVSYAAAGNVVGLCQGDVNGDGQVDLIAVSARSPAGFSVLPGTGTGAFGAPIVTSSPNALLTHCVAADLNGDGHVDVAVTNSTTSTVDIYYGNGSASFGAPTSYAVGNNACSGIYNASPNDIKVADLNGDGRLDLVVSNSSDVACQSACPNTVCEPCTTNLATISVLLGAAGGTFEAQNLYPADVWPAQVQLVDINQDGHTDIVTACGTQTTMSENYNTVPFANSINIYLGHGDGTFASRQSLTVGTSATSVVVADFDGDGLNDLGYSSNTSYGAGILFARGPNTYLAPSAKLVGTTGKSWSVVADFNGDGLNDFVGGFINQPPTLYLNQGNGNFTWSMIPGLWTVIPGLFDGPVAIDGPTGRGGDFNGDGNQDFVTPAFYQNVVVYAFGDGTGNFSKTLVPYPQSAMQRISIDTGDFDTNGLDDAVIVYPSTNTVFLFYSNPGSTSPTIVSFDVPSGQGSCTMPVVADVNNDGFQDLLIGCQNLVVYLNDGHGNMQSPNVYSKPAAASDVQSIAVIDLNNDTFVDVVSMSNNQLTVLLNDGTGAFPLAQANTTTQPYSSNGSAPLAGGDVNQDGYMDLIVASTPGFFVLAGHGDGTLSAPVAYMGGLTNSVNIADLNNDGLPDILAMTEDGGPVIYDSNGCSN